MDAPSSRLALPELPPRMGAPAWGLYRGALDLGPDAPTIPAAALRHKRWIYLGIYDPQYVLGVAVVDLGFASNAFAYLGGIEPRAMRTWKAVGTPWSASVDRQRATWRSAGASIAARVPIKGSAGSLRATLATTDGPLDLDLTLTTPRNIVSSVTCVAPAGDDEHHRWNVTVKDNTLTAKGVLRWGTEERRIDSAAIVDVTDAYPPRRTRWHWASLAGRDTQGRAVGVNLCALHNDSERARENVLWVDGRPLPLGAVRFSFDRNARDIAPWTMTGEGVDLRFTPSGMRDGHENLVLVTSSFVQPYGRFSGEVRVGDVAVTLDNVSGVVEDHEALW